MASLRAAVKHILVAAGVNPAYIGSINFESGSIVAKTTIEAPYSELKATVSTINEKKAEMASNLVKTVSADPKITLIVNGPVSAELQEVLVPEKPPTTAADNDAPTQADSCGIRLHEGTSCFNYQGGSTQVGGHLYNKGIVSEDPWLPVKYVVGAGKPDGSVEVETGLALSQLDGHVVVVYAKDGSRVACGKVEVVDTEEEEAALTALSGAFPIAQEVHRPMLSIVLVASCAAVGLITLLVAAGAYRRTHSGEAVPSDEEFGTPFGTSPE